MTFGLFLLASLLVVGGEVAEASEELEARWRREYPAAAERWETVANDVMARGEFSLRRTSGTTTTTKKLLVATAGDKRLIEFDERSSGKPGQASQPDDSLVRCQTDKVVFQLSKPPSSDTWLLGHYDRRNPEEDVYFEVDSYCDRFLRGATVYYGISFLDRMRDPSFDLNSIEALEIDGTEAIRIRYSYESEVASETGMVDLVPANNWAIKGTEVNIENKKGFIPIVFTNKVEYEMINGDQLFPVRMEIFERTPNPNVYQHTRSFLEDVTIGGVPDSMFSLTAYGLPEVPLSPAPRPSIFTFSNPFLWLALVGTVGSFSLLWVMRSRRRRLASS